MAPMRSYHDPIEVHRGLVSGQEAPEQFLWRDRLWVVREVIAHWVETGAWWDQPGVAALFGRRGMLDETSHPDLLAEREVWRVEAGRGRQPDSDGPGTGVFDVSYDSTDGCWRLLCAVD
jgi:uncharacterized protein DUF6504